MDPTPRRPKELEQLGLGELAESLSEEAGRDVNFIIFEETAAATGRSLSIVGPR